MIIRVNVYFHSVIYITARGHSKYTPFENRRKRIEGKKGGEINDFKRGIRKFIEIRKILSMVDDCKYAWRILNRNLVFVKG